MPEKTPLQMWLEEFVVGPGCRLLDAACRLAAGLAGLALLLAYLIWTLTVAHTLRGGPVARTTPHGERRTA